MKKRFIPIMIVLILALVACGRDPEELVNEAATKAAEAAATAAAIATDIADGSDNGGSEEVESTPEPTEEPTPEPTPDVPTDRWAGTTVDMAGAALGNATITINSVETQSDGNGNFELFVPIADDARYVINAALAGYLPISQIHIGSAMEAYPLEFRPVYTETFDPTVGVEAEDPSGTQISVGPNQLEDADGNEPTGDVTLNMYTYDLENEEMVGDMSGKNSDGDDVYMESEGAFYASFEDEEGTEYNLKDDTTADISIPCDPRPDEILTVWSYDETTGLWIEEDPIVTEQDGRCSAPVSHFSYWNFDYEKSTPSCIKLEVDADFLAANTPLNVKAILQTNPVRVQQWNVTDTENVLYNLPTNIDVQFFMPSDAAAPFTTINSGAPWGNVGAPPQPYDVCNGVAEIQPGVQGHVVDLDSREPLPGAQVCVQGTSQCATVDSSGNYTLADIGAGDVTFEVTYTDYITATETVAVPANVLMNQDFALTANNPVVAVLPDAVVLRGTIVDYGDPAKETVTIEVGDIYYFGNLTWGTGFPEYDIVAGGQALGVIINEGASDQTDIVVPNRSTTEIGKAANANLEGVWLKVTAVGEANQPVKPNDVMEVVLTDPNSSNLPYTVNFYRGEGQARELVATFTINNQ